MAGQLGVQDHVRSCSTPLGTTTTFPSSTRTGGCTAHTRAGWSASQLAFTCSGLCSAEYLAWAVAAARGVGRQNPVHTEGSWDHPDLQAEPSADAHADDAERPRG